MKQRKLNKKTSSRQNLRGFQNQQSHRAGPRSLLIAITLSVSGCAQTPGQDGLTQFLNPNAGSSNMANVTTGSIGKPGPLTPQNVQAIISQARALQDDGKPAQALTSLAKAQLKAPKNEDILVAYARTAIEQGQGKLAYDIISRAEPSARANHRLLSLRGAALASLGKHDAAHKAFEKALKQSPDDPTLLNNLAMSHALKGNVKKAEVILRKAAANTNDKKVRQNLALMLGLQGRFSEARKLPAASETPVAQNAPPPKAPPPIVKEPLPAAKETPVAQNEPPKSGQWKTKTLLGGPPTTTN